MEAAVDGSAEEDEGSDRRRLAGSSSAAIRSLDFCLPSIVIAAPLRPQFYFPNTEIPDEYVVSIIVVDVFALDGCWSVVVGRGCLNVARTMATYDDGRKDLICVRS